MSMLQITLFCMLLYRTYGASELLQNPDFEATNPVLGWDCIRCTATVSKSDKYSGHQALKITGRQEYWSGIQQTVPLRTNTRYHIQTHVKQLTDQHDKMYQQYSIFLETVLSNGTRKYDEIVVDKSISTRSGWVTLFSHFIYPYTGFKEVHLRVRGPEPGVNFLVDGMTLTEIPEDKNWKSKADARIDKIRKNNIHFQINVPPHVALTDLEIQVDLTRHSFPFGSQTTWKTLFGYPHYADLFYYMFNWATLSNYYWHSSPPPRENPDYSNATRALNLLHQHGIPVRAHNMFWAGEEHTPDWIRTLSASQLEKEVEHRIQYVVKDTKGKVQHWDVMNERAQAHYYEEKTKDPDYTKKIYAKVHKADPNVKLFLNEDHVVSSGVSTSAFINLAKSFKSANVGLYGLGIECHFLSDQPPDPTLMKIRLDQLSVTGLPMWVTEMDLVVHDENTRADWYDTALRMLFSYPDVEGIILWGFWDVKHWRGPDAALVSGNGYKVNAAGKRYIDLLYKEWSTHVTHKASAGTRFDVRGFHGDYDVIVKYRGAPVKKQTFSLKKTDMTVIVDITDVNHNIAIQTTKSPVDYTRPLPQHHVVHIAEHTIGHMTSGSSSHLSCISRFSANSEVADDKFAEVGCPSGYVLTGCAGRSRNNLYYRDGEVILNHNGMVCRSYNGAQTTAPVQAVARCCKLTGLTCMYRQSGPSQTVLDQRIETRCLNNMYATGCAAHTSYLYMDGTFQSTHSCIAQNQLSEGRINSYAACCSAPHLTCQLKVSKPTGDRVGDQTSVSCDQGWEMMGCSAYSEDAGLAGAYIDICCDRHHASPIVHLIADNLRPFAHNGKRQWAALIHAYTVNCQQSHADVLKSLHGKLDAVHFQSAEVRNSYQCRSLCVVTPLCEGSDFDVQSRTCNLYSSLLLDGAGILSVPEMVYHRKDRQENSGACEHDTCGNEEICVTSNSGETHLCIPASDCGSPPLIENLTHPSLTRTTLGTEFTYTCDLGYNKTGGRGVVVCRNSGAWSLPSLECQVVECGDPTQKPNMDLGSMTSKQYNSTILYNCALGFNVTIGDGVSTCQHTGIWSTPTLVCDLIPNLITTASLSTGPVQLICTTKQISISSPVQACKEDEILVDCSATFKFLRRGGRQGIEIVEENGKAHCKLYHVDVHVNASARCCKVIGLECEYLHAGPSQVANDQAAIVKCYKDFSVLGCSAYITNGTLDGGQLNSASCSGYRGSRGSTGVFTNGVCCKAPGMSCHVIRSSPAVSGGEMSFRCSAGQVMTGCTGYNARLAAHGSYITDINGEPTCNVATRDVRTEVYVTCCTV